MFGKPNQYGTVAGFNVRVKDEREKDRNHLVEVTFELPLTFELADEISPAIARDLFNDVKGDWVPKPEISTLGMNLAPETQLMTIRTHPDLDPETKITGVSLRKIQAKKGEAGTWMLTFTSTWVLGDPKEAITMIQRLKTGVYLTFEQQQPNLDMDGPADNAVDGEVVANIDQGGNVTAITTRRKRRKKGDDPETQAEQQAADADARKALPPPDEQIEGQTPTEPPPAQ